MTRKRTEERRGKPRPEAKTPERPVDRDGRPLGEMCYLDEGGRVQDRALWEEPDEGGSLNSEPP